jgi:hypothetical protein
MDSGGRFASVSNVETVLEQGEICQGFVFALCCILLV